MRFSIDERQVHLTIITVQAIISLLIAVAAPVFELGTSVLGPAILSTIAYAGIWFAYRQGWHWPRVAIVVVTAIVVGLYIFFDERSHEQFTPIFFVPLVLALIFIGSFGILGTGAALIAGLAIILPSPNPYTEPLRLVSMITIVGGMALARGVLDTMHNRAEEAAQAARQAQDRAEQDADLARTQAAELAARSEEQRRLLDLVSDLETPAISLSEGILMAPIVGNLDTRRASSLGAKLLQSVHDNQAKLLIVDLAGMNLVDTQVAQALSRMIASIRLLGCAVTVTSISAQVAMALTHLGIGFGDVLVARSPQEALSIHLQKIAEANRKNSPQS